MSTCRSLASGVASSRNSSSESPSCYSWLWWATVPCKTSNKSAPWQTHGRRPVREQPRAGQRLGYAGACRRGWPCSRESVRLLAMPVKHEDCSRVAASRSGGAGNMWCACTADLVVSGVACTQIVQSAYLHHCAGVCGDHAGGAWCASQSAHGGSHGAICKVCGDSNTKRSGERLRSNNTLL